MPLKIASSKNRYPLPWLDYEEEAVSDHGRVEDLRLGRKPAGNRLIYFSIYLRWTEIKILLCQRLRVLDDCIRKNVLANNFLFFFSVNGLCIELHTAYV
jgi:hypothetical protein